MRAYKNGENVILIQTQIVHNLLWQQNFWSPMDLYNFVCRFQKRYLFICQCIREGLRSYFVRSTSNFCQSALLWPTKSTRRSKGCGLLWCCVAGKKSVLFWPSEKNLIPNPHSFDPRMCIMWTRSKQCRPFWIDIFNSSSYFDIKKFYFQLILIAHIKANIRSFPMV